MTQAERSPSRPLQSWTLFPRSPAGSVAGMRRALAIGLLLLASCDEVPFPTLFVFADPENVELCCNPDETFPLVVEEFDVYTDGPTAGIDPDSYEVRLDYTSTSDAVTLSVPSGGSLPFGRASVDVLVDSCGFGEALLDIEITLSGERLGGSTFQTGWIGKITITDTCS